MFRPSNGSTSVPRLLSWASSGRANNSVNMRLDTAFHWISGSEDNSTIKHISLFTTVCINVAAKYRMRDAMREVEKREIFKNILVFFPFFILI